MGTLQQSQSKKTQATAKQQATSNKNCDIHPAEEIQEMFGNQALGRLIESQSSQDQPTDNSPNLLLKQISTANNSPLQRRSFFRGLSHELAGNGQGYLVQAKLTVNQPGDKYEQEADRVAAQVVKQINHPISQPSANPEAVHSQKLMRKSVSSPQPIAGGIATTPHLETAIKQQQGQGQPISEDIREPLEESFGADLSGVRVHTDDQSDELNRSIQSLAFTKGRDIFFKRGAYQPRSLKGQELLAHELTHVIQQGGQGRLVQRKDDDKPKQTLKKSKGGIDISKDVTGEIGIFKFTSQNLEHNDAQDALKGDGTVIIPDLNNTTASVSGMVVDSEGIDWDKITVKTQDIKLGEIATITNIQGNILGKKKQYQSDVSGTFGVDLSSQGLQAKTSGTVNITYAAGTWKYAITNGSISATIDNIFKLDATEINYDNINKSIGILKASVIIPELNNTSAAVEKAQIDKNG
ncbi:DUF4157 domain-containing protein, partial [Aphanizomenon sp. 202]|nr:DUF4157 domain-containing protein [Aphanizomenon sp. 202]